MPDDGSRRMTAPLRHEGYHINRKAVQRHMREMGITAIYPGPNLSRRAHQASIAPYLLRHSTPDYPNHIWAIDITYIRLTRSWLYLVAVMIERFWRKLKYNNVYLKGYTTPCAARQGIADYMTRYNEIRFHLDYGSVLPHPLANNLTGGSTSNRNGLLVQRQHNRKIIDEKVVYLPSE